MIEHQTINHQDCVVVYLNDDFSPATKEAHALVKIIYPNGASTFVVPGAVTKAQYAALAERLRKYNPNQERDDHGRFAGAGGSEDSPLTGEERVMYHGTKKQYLDSIKEKGLVTTGVQRNYFPNGGYYEGERGESIYVTHDPEVAQTYAKEHTAMSQDPVVLEIHIPKEEKDKLKSDEKDDNGYRFPKNIPPQWIYYQGGPLAKSQPDFYAVVVCDNGKEAALRKYSPDQARDERGRFGEGSGGSGTHQTSTPAFKAWFGDSKAVDEKGKPMVMYHGTDQDFSAFSREAIASKYDYSYGFHFSNKPEDANVYADQEHGARIVPVYLSAQNPLTFTLHGDQNPEGYSDTHKSEIIQQLYDAKQAGKPYDSVILNSERYGTNVIVFQPTQIKSAVGNSGAFDPNNHNIDKTLRKYNPNQERDDHGRFTWTGHSEDSPLTGEEHVVYHGTAKAYLDSIKQQGLVTLGVKRNFPVDGPFPFYQGTRGESVFVTYDPEVAKSYAETAQRKSNSTPVTLEIRIPKDEAAKLVSDSKDDFGYMFPSHIPPQWIYHQGGPLAKSKADFYVVVLCDGGVSKSFQSTLDRLRKYNEDEPRDDHGRWTDGGGGSWVAQETGVDGGQWVSTPELLGGQAHSDELKNVWVAQSPFGNSTVQEVQEAARKDQADLAKVGSAIATDTGTKFVNPGIKENVGRIQEKLNSGRTLPEVTDISRAAFVIDKPSEATAVVAGLREHFNVLDEGFRVYAGGYFDKKLLVQYESGLIGEVQVLPREMYSAKMEGGGHDLYTAARSLSANDPKLASLTSQMSDVYGAALGKMDPSWKAVLGK